jgi:predicted transposase/invertase (TIGR01784 family)
MKRDDSLWKSLLEDIFDDFLLFFFKENSALFNFEKGFEFLNNELAQLFPDDENSTYPKFVDKLVKVFTTDNREEWILVHVEVQGYNDKDFAERMFTYFYRILDKYNKRVTCIAIFTGNRQKTITQQYNYDFLGTEVNFKYNLYKIIEQNRDELLSSNNPFAFVIVTVLIALQKSQLQDEDILKLYITIAKTLLQKSIPKHKIRALMSFLRHYVHFDNPANMIKFDKEINSITNNDFMGIEEFLLDRAKKEGEREGIEKSKAWVVRSLLMTTEFDEQKIASIVDVAISFVEKIKAEMK